MRKVFIALFVIAALSSSYYFFIIENETNPLELPAGAPQPLVTLKGKLVCKLFPGPPEYSSIGDGDRADYCWVLKLDSHSLSQAFITPVAPPASNLEDITRRPQYDEIFLVMDEEMKHFCHAREGLQVTAEGHLFHAHTAHHYTPMLMDVKKIL